MYFADVVPRLWPLHDRAATSERPRAAAGPTRGLTEAHSTAGTGARPAAAVESDAAFGGNVSFVGVALDVDGDGAFSAADYVALMRLGLLWTNTYAADAAPWLEAFREVTAVEEVSAVQLQSTDPDFLYASPSMTCTHAPPPLLMIW